jgi:predicted DsbA family dithiol-disulfide isomerase
MRVEVWSDVVCPWCYVGKRRLETALERFEHRDQVEVVWRSFQLDPTAPEGETHPTLPALAAKYGVPAEQMRENMRGLEELAAAEGLEYHLADGISGNTLLAHELLHLAAEHGNDTRNELKERLLHAYFEEQRSVFDVDSLVPLAVEVGLDEAEVREALTDRRYRAAVVDDSATAIELGAAGPRACLARRQPADHGARRRRLHRRQLHRLAQQPRDRPQGRLGVRGHLADDVGRRPLRGDQPDRLARVERGVRRVAAPPRLDHQRTGFVVAEQLLLAAVPGP